MTLQYYNTSMMAMLAKMADGTHSFQKRFYETLFESTLVSIIKVEYSKTLYTVSSSVVLKEPNKLMKNKCV